MKTRSALLLPLLLLMLGFQLSAQQYNEHDKQQLRKFLRQTSNLEQLGLTSTDTLNWLTSEDWLRNMRPNILEWTNSSSPYALKSVNLDYYLGTYPTGMLDLSNCQSLEHVDLSDVGINSLNVSNCELLEVVSIQQSPIDNINLDNLPNLRSLNLLYTNLNFNSLPKPEVMSEKGVVYVYSSQTLVSIKSNIAVNGSVDLSYLGGMTYEWYSNSGAKLTQGVDYQVSGGITTFLKEQKELVLCNIRNTNYPYLTLRTDRVAVTKDLVAKDNYNEHDLQLLKNYVRQSSDISFLNLSKSDTLNWSSSNSWVEKLSSFNWGIYNSQYHIYSITIHSPVVRDNIMVNFSGCEALEAFYIQEDKSQHSPLIENFNFTNCANLYDIKIFYSCFKNLTVDGCSNLNTLSIANYGENADLTTQHVLIDTLDLSSASNLAFLGIWNSNIKNIDISNLRKLNTLSLQNNLLENIKFDTFDNLSFCRIERNRLNFKTVLPESAVSGRYFYASQHNIDIEKTYKTDTLIDLEFTGGISYTWKKEDGNTLSLGTDYIVNQGVTVFLQEQTDSVYCEITNYNTPLLILNTTKTKITNTPQSIVEDQLLATVDGAVGVISITTDTPMQYAIYATSGKAVANGIANGETIVPAQQGVYIVQIEGVSGKVIVR